ncbi:zinc ribbon domain-containing protein, partial [Streptomyces sp. NPDC055768]
MTTQNCAECGTPAEPGQSFCDACGAVLRWDQAGARTAQPATASAAGRDAAAPPAARLMAHLIEVSGLMMAGPTVLN